MTRVYLDPLIAAAQSAVDETERRLIAAAQAVEAAIANCHEARPCPRCQAPTGERCRNQNIGKQRHGAPLKHPHRERYDRGLTR